MGAWKEDLDEETERLDRQKAAWGAESLGRIKDLNVLVIGMGGVGVETEVVVEGAHQVARLCRCQEPTVDRAAQRTREDLELREEQVPEDLRPLLDRLLDGDPERRPASAEEVVQELLNVKHYWDQDWAPRLSGRTTAPKVAATRHGQFLEAFS